MKRREERLRRSAAILAALPRPAPPPAPGRRPTALPPGLPGGSRWSPEHGCFLVPLKRPRGYVTSVVFNAF
jgi:hypothetical protein